MTASLYMEKNAGLKRFALKAERILNGDNIQDALSSAKKRYADTARRTSRIQKNSGVKPSMRSMIAKHEVDHDVLNKGMKKVKIEKIKTYGSRTAVGTGLTAAGYQAIKDKPKKVKK